jgi:putative ABC transport system substrate-binding protein
MTRRELLIWLAAGAALLAPVASFAQDPGKVWRIGLLAARLDFQDRLNALRQGMQELGYIEGKNLIIETRSTDGQYGPLLALAQELVRLKVDVIVTIASPAVRAAQQATTTIPIVIGVTGDAVASGLVASLARPGGNTTGLSNLVSDISTKHLDLMAALVPQMSRIAVLANPGSASHAPILKSVKVAAQRANVAVVSVDAGRREEIERGFATMKQERAEAVIVAADTWLLFAGGCNTRNRVTP